MSLTPPLSMKWRKGWGTKANLQVMFCVAHVAPSGQHK
jgi:hypothetical protein